jgi:hypothetical protein
MAVDDESQLGELADYGSEMPDLDDEDECEAPDIGSYDEFEEYARESASWHVGMFRRLAGLGSRVRRTARAE